MKITHKIKLDLVRRGITPQINAVQGDALSRVVQIALLADGAAWKIPEGTQVLLRYRRADNICGACNTLPDGTPAGWVSGNTVTVTLPPEVLAAAGLCSVTVTLVLGEKEVSTFAFLVEVQDCPAGENYQDGSYISIAGLLPDPGNAQPGQVFTVEELDPKGRVKQLKAVDYPAVFRVTLTEQPDGSYTADQSTAQLLDAYHLGRPLCAVFPGEDPYLLPLTEIDLDEGYLTFSMDFGPISYEITCSVDTEFIEPEVVRAHQLMASDVHALPDTTMIPSKLSQLTNDCNYATRPELPRTNYFPVWDNGDGTGTMDQLAMETIQSHLGLGSTFAVTLLQGTQALGSGVLCPWNGDYFCTISTADAIYTIGIPAGAVETCAVTARAIPARVSQLNNDSGYLSYQEQALSATQQSQARANIGATTAAEVMVSLDGEIQNLIANSQWNSGYVSRSLTPVTAMSSLHNGEAYVQLPALEINTDYTFEFRIPAAWYGTAWYCFVSFDSSGNILERLAYEENVDGAVGNVVGDYACYQVSFTPTKAAASAYLSFRTFGNKGLTTEEEKRAGSVNWAENNTSLYNESAKGGSRLLPVVSGTHNGRVPMVEEGKWVLGTPETVTAPLRNPHIKSINHRGYNSVAPENTLSAYRLSKKMGFDMAECDVSFTSDGYAVLLHDGTVDRTSDGTGTIGELTFEYVRSLDFGSWKSDAYTGEQIPTFEEFIALCKKIGLHPYIELKGVPTQEQINGLVATVKKYGMLRNVTWISASSSVVGPLVKTADPKARIGCVGSELNQAIIDIAAGLKTDDNDVFLNVYSGFTEDLVAQCVEKDIPLETWNGEDVVTILDAWPYISGFTTDVVVAGLTLYQSVQ